jgi:DNA repair exonuclease SbcCD ATPase subunit
LTGKNLDWDKEISNGAGKSSFVTLPFLALFGRTFKDQTFDGWARQGAKRSAVASQTLTLADGRQVTVTRGRKPNSFQVVLDGQDVTMGDANKTQDFLEKLTNLSWSVLTNAVYVGQDEIGSVFGTDKERKELFSRLLGLERFLDASEKLRKVLRRIENAEAECAAGIAAAAHALLEAQLAVKNLDGALAAMPEVNKPELIQKQRRLNETESLLRLDEKTKEDLQPELDRNQRLYEKALFAGVDIETRIGVLREQIAASEKVEGQCPVCGSKVGVEKLEQYQDALRQKIQSLEETLTGHEETQRKNRIVRKALQARFSECDLDMDKLRKEQKALLQETTGLAARAEARGELVKLQADAAGRIRTLERRHTIQQRAFDETLDEKLFVQTCMAVVSRDGLPAYLMAEAAPRLNQAAADYSEIFTAGEIGVHFGLDNGDIDIGVVNPHGGQNIKDQSRGEMRMAALIAALSFRDVLVKHNVLILDEPTDGLDPVNAAAFARGLNRVVGRFQHVVVISHNASLLAGIEPTLHLEIEKTGGVSRLKAV